MTIDPEWPPDAGDGPSVTRWYTDPEKYIGGDWHRTDPGDSVGYVRSGRDSWTWLHVHDASTGETETEADARDELEACHARYVEKFTDVEEYTCHE